MASAFGRERAAMPSRGDSAAHDRYRDLYRRVAAVLARHAFPMHETAAVHCAPAAGVTYQRGGIHYVVPDVRAVFGEILVLLDEAADRDAPRAALRAVRDRLAHGDVDAVADALTRIEAALAGPAEPLREARPGGIDGWCAATRAKLDRAVAVADEREADEWWHGFASGLSEALNAHAAYVARGRGICVASDRRHAVLWRSFRAQGEPICSRWIDPVDASDPLGWPADDAAECGVTILYAETGDIREDALVAAGAALAAGREILFVGTGLPASLLSNPLVRCEGSLADAFAEARRILGWVDPPPLPSWLFGPRPP